MKVLLDATSLHTTVGGVETYLVNLLQGWKATAPEDEFRVVSSGNATEAFKSSVTAVGTLQTVGNDGFASRFLTQQTAIRLAAHRFSPDVMLAATPVMPVGPLRVPVVAVVHDLRYKVHPGEFSRAQLAYRKLLYTYCYRHADALLAISETTRDQLIKHYPEVVARTHVVYHGADHVDGWIRPEEHGQHAIAFGHWRNKRPDLCVRVWAQLRDQIPNFNWTLNVVGLDAESRRQLTALVDELGIDRQVLIHPFLPHTEFRRLFASASLLLFPSTDEGFGFPVVEAMRLGVPVVCSDLPALREVAADGALYSDSGNLDSFTSQSASIIQNAGVARALRARAIEHASRYTWRDTAEQTRQVLEAVCHHEPTSAQAQIPI